MYYKHCYSCKELTKDKDAVDLSTFIGRCKITGTEIKDTLSGCMVIKGRQRKCEADTRVIVNNKGRR